MTDVLERLTSMLRDGNFDMDREEAARMRSLAISLSKPFRPSSS